MAGRVSEIYAQEGDAVQTGGKILKLIDDEYLTVRLPFSESDAERLYEGQTADVTVENTFETLSGSIEKIYDTSRVLDWYVTVTDVEVRLENPGALSSGTYVTVRADGASCYESGALEGGAEKVVLAQGSGMLEELHVVEGEYVGAGAVVATLSNDSIEDSMRDSSLSLQEAELSYQNTEKQLSDYKITAPITGSVISKTVKAGDTLESGTKTVMAVVADMSVMRFTINVDELDIAKIEKGQIADITVDALPEMLFTGMVDNVGILGVSNNGVTTYPVVVAIDQTEGLWPGMNATANIVVDSAENVLTIPVAAVNRGNTVLVKEGGSGVVVEVGDAVDVEDTIDAEDAGGAGNTRRSTTGAMSRPETGAANRPETGAVNRPETGGAPAPATGDSMEFSAENSLTADAETGAAGAANGFEREFEIDIDQTGAPEGARYVRVTLGLNNDSFIEVRSGLREGDIVLVPMAAENELMQNVMMGPGMMGGGVVVRGEASAAPAGGRPPQRQTMQGGGGG
jgi:multidrug efflux pump subunit AcrA (membrane-fusion protein)